MVFLGYLPVDRLLDEGVCVALGADATAAANSLDMFKEMLVAALIHKGHSEDPKTLPAERVIEMATINGAKALNWDSEIGSIEPGKRADIIIIDTAQPHMVPMSDVVSNIVYSARGSDVKMVIVDGKVVVRDRVVMTVSEDKILAQATELAANVLRRNKIQVTQRFPVE